MYRAFLDLVYPPRCLLCDADCDPAPHSLCPACLPAITADSFDTCPRCASSVGPHVDLSAGCPRCAGEAYRFDAAFRLGPYDGRLRDAVLRAKSASGESLAETLGAVWADVRRDRFAAAAPNVVIPVPLHWVRRLTRGYNQAAAVAHGVADRCGVACRPGWLRRVRNTPHQMGQSAAERRANVRGAFRASTLARVRGLRVLLIDDVLTTGATLDDAARALKEVGAAQVTAAVLAHR